MDVVKLHETMSVITDLELQVDHLEGDLKTKQFMLDEYFKRIKMTEKQSDEIKQKLDHTYKALETLRKEFGDERTKEGTEGNSNSGQND